ncbi:MAG: HNH endonuclease signature motif containing protein [Acidobacteriota bacterium]
MPRPAIAKKLRRFVIQRAHGCCEYCLLHQDDAPDSHQIDHIIALRHKGSTKRHNLACACADCNRQKGTDFGTIDPRTGAVIFLFNPRRQKWPDHFRLDGARIIGLTPAGQATIELLRLNDDRRLLERELLIAAGCYPRPADGKN